MKVTLDLYNGPDHSKIVTKKDIQKTIDSINRAIKNKKTAVDDAILIDTISIFEGVQTQLKY